VGEGVSVIGKKKGKVGCSHREPTFVPTKPKTNKKKIRAMVSSSEEGKAHTGVGSEDAKENQEELREEDTRKEAVATLAKEKGGVRGGRLVPRLGSSAEEDHLVGGVFVCCWGRFPLQGRTHLADLALKRE